MFCGHKTKTLQVKVDEFEEEISKKNGVVNRVVEERRESQKKLTEANRHLDEHEGGGRDPC
jgi:peptidoglycan hydrolase CwlO-like protein